MRRSAVVCLLALVALGCASAAPQPLVYLPFEGTAAPYLGPAAQSAGSNLTYDTGHQGRAVRLDGDLRLPSHGSFNVAEGTFALWLKLDPGQFDAPRYLLCLYGGPDQPDGWQHSRVSIYLAGDKLVYAAWDKGAGRVFLETPLPADAADRWLHVAVTWTGLDSTAKQGIVRLYLDGRQAAEQTGLSCQFGQVSPTLDVGRDSDASPDYPNALFDELYLYDVALPADTIAAAAAAPANAASTTPIATGPARADWWNPAWPLRIRATLAAAQTDREQLVLEVPIDFGNEAAALLHHPVSVTPGSYRVVPAGSQRPVPSSVDGDHLAWSVPGIVPAGETREFEIYFMVDRYDLSTPLQAVRLSTPPATGDAAELALPDYATVTYGDAWDFDEGDLEEIDQWGNKPEYITGREVVDGALHLRVQKDPWFIWGNMWGQVANSRRPVDIDFDRYSLLELRVKQSVSSAEWTLYARVTGGERLVSYDFRVNGTGWQTKRIDLYRDARFRGHVTAFRIDPTNDADAEVWIDSVKLLAVTKADLGLVSALGSPSAPPAKLSVSAPARAEVGSRQQAVVTVLDAQGRPVSAQPVTVQLTGGGVLAVAKAISSAGGERERRGVTDAEGQLSVTYVVARQAGPSAGRLTALAEGTKVTGTATVEALAGPPSQLVLTPSRATILPAGQKTLALKVQVADAFGNPLPQPNRDVTCVAPAGWSLKPTSGRTATDGSLSVTLTLDPAKRWVGRVTAREGEGLEGTSGAVCYTMAQRDWGVTIGDSGYFRTADGQGWLPLGGFYANWVGNVPAEGEAGRQLTSFVDTTDEQKTTWLKFLADNGVTAMRFMLRAHRPGGMEPLDIGGKVNPELYAEALRYMDLARPFGIRFLLVLHEDYTKPMYFNAEYREQFCLPVWQGLDQTKLTPAQRRFVVEGRLLDKIEDKYTDPDAMACQDLYATELINYLQHNPQVFAYELENEQVGVPREWINHACEVIRKVDPRTPICMSHGGGGLHTGDPYYWRTQSTIDFYTYHLYPTGTTNPDVDYGLATDVLTRYGRMAGRCFYGECVGDEFGYGAAEPVRRQVARDLIWYSLVNANPGCFFWNSRGDELNEFRRAKQIADRLKLAEWRPQRAPIGIGVDHPLDGDRWFRTPEGLKEREAMRKYARHYLREGALFDFTWQADGYDATAKLDPFAPPAAQPGPVVPPKGFEATSYVRDNGVDGLCYVRNVSGVVKWTSEERRARTMYLRSTAAVPCRLTVHVGGQVVVTDLVSGQEVKRSVKPGEVLDLGTTDHDFAVSWGR